MKIPYSTYYNYNSYSDAEYDPDLDPFCEEVKITKNNPIINSFSSCLLNRIVTRRKQNGINNKVKKGTPS